MKIPTEIRERAINGLPPLLVFIILVLCYAIAQASAR